MPIGSPLTLDLPSAADSFAVWTAKMKAAIQTIEEILEAKVTAGSLNITTPLSIGGSYIYNLSYAKFAPQGSAPDNGTGIVYFDTAGDIVVITPSGAVKLTSGGSINIAAVNGIGGDYGGANPAIVSYDTLSGEYRFYENGTGTYATLAANDIVLRNNPAPGSVRIKPTAAVTTNLEFYIETLPTSGIGGLAYDAAKKAVVDATVTRETITHLFTDVNASGSVTANKHPRTGIKVRTYPAAMFADTTTGVLLPRASSGSSPPVYRSLISNGQTAAIVMGPFEQGEEISKIIVVGTSGGAGATFSQVLTIQSSNTASNVPASSSGTFITTGNYTLTPTTPIGLPDGYCVCVTLASTGANLAYLHEIHVYYTLPTG